MFDTIIDETGNRHGNLLVIRAVRRNGAENNSLRWLCKCDCGAEILKVGSSLRIGKTSHLRCPLGLRPSSIEAVWQSMMDRCYNPRSKGYRHYGERGIRVCERWHTRELFISDMGPKPSGLTLDRINNDLGYSPENCRWATHDQQARNKRSSVYIEHEGKRMCVTDWARLIGIDPSTLRKRLLRNLTIEQALNPSTSRRKT